MVAYIRSDLEFILKQIKIAEGHAAGQPLYGEGGLVPAYNVSWGLRTVDGSYNHLLPGQEQWGAAGGEFPTLVDPTYRPAPVFFGATAPNYNPMNKPGAPLTDPTALVVDPSIRTTSNLLVDQTLSNPAAVLTALERAGRPDPMADLPFVTAINNTFAPVARAEYLARVAMQNAKAAADDLGDGDLNTPASAAELAALALLATKTADHAAANSALTAARVVRDAALEQYGVEMDGDNVAIPNQAPDEGLSAPFNSWFTLFGQFFDHGLDLVNKGGSGTVYIPLSPDDPLYVPGSNTNFMVLTRATVLPGPDGILDNPDTEVVESTDDIMPVNTTTAYVDQNQTYTSHPSHQVFLRQYAPSADGPIATGKLIEGGGNGGMATWGEVKAQAKAILGIELTDFDVGSVPLLRTDPYGNFIPNAAGYPQVILGVGPDGVPNTADDIVASGTAASPINPSTVTVQVPVTVDGTTTLTTYTGALRTPHAFLADIAHDAVPIGKIADGDITIGLANPGNGDIEYDNELLDAHFIAGDGRVNENIGLTAVHHVFHAEHNRLVEHTKAVVIADAQAMLAGGASPAEAVAFLNEWLNIDVGSVPGTPAAVAALTWDGERLFQAAKFGTEMQYQHLVFEEFARKIQPNVNVFIVPDGFDTTIDPSIVAEFAHVVYRFGHSMLTESIDRFSPTFDEDHIGLIEGFLNPIAFDGGDSGTAHSITDAEAAGAIIRGMTRQVGNEIDEFVTTALRNNLLGLPLDLATINLARGRDTGVPSLNEARAQFYEATNHDVLLKPYESWVDFASHLKHEASIINFIAAYGTHSLITGETTIEGKRDAALTLITGSAVGKFAEDSTFVMPLDPDVQDFLNGLGSYASNLGGLNNVDLWIGGLAEEIMPFGGMLGSTFNFVFEVQMEKLQNGDRFYYLQRLDGLHLFGEMENNSFASMIMRNTDARHLPSDVFSTPNLILEVDRAKQFNDLNGDGILESADPVGPGILTQLVIRNNPATSGADTNYLKYTGGDHVLLGGTEGADTLIAGIGDDTLFGDGGNDQLQGGFGNDIINGGAGDDIIVDSGGDDNIKAGDGNDVVHAGPGLDLVLGGKGQDFIFLGTDMGSEVFAGEGNDFIYGNKNAERILGNEGDDWMETGTFDGAPGDNFDEIFAQDGVEGHDVFLGDGGFDEFIAEGGDDIMVGSAGRGKMVGMSGWDWATYKDNTIQVDADLSRGIVFDENPNPPINGTLDAYEGVEGLSGTRFNDTLTGSDVIAEERLPFAQGGTEGYRGSQLTKEGIARIAGLRDVLGLTEAQFNALASGAVAYNAGEIILGGDGSDTIMGRGGDDIIDGDKWLDVNIAVYAATDTNHTSAPIAVFKSMTQLANRMFDGTYNPSQLAILRQIVSTGDTTPDIDTAKFQGGRGEYAFSATADGQVIVTHAVENSLDGTDRLRNIEKVQFATGNALNIIVGTPYNDNGAAPQGAAPLNQPVLNGTATDDLILGLAGTDILNGGGGNDILVGGPGMASGEALDTFSANTYSNNNGTLNFGGNWTEEGETTTSPTGGDILITGGRLNFNQNVDGGETIARALDLAGATSATVRFDYQEGLDTGENIVLEAWNGSAWQILRTFLGSATDASAPFSIDLTPAQIGSHTQIRFRTEGSWENTDAFFVDNFRITATGNVGVDTLNGGTGDDTYSFALGDGNAIINEAASGGGADRISILSTTIDPVSGLPVLAGLNAQDNNQGTTTGDLVINYSLPNGATPSNQTIRVAGHFTQTTPPPLGVEQTGVELINFNNATYEGYLLGAADYVISRADPANRDAGGVNLATSTANNFIAGEQNVADVITGGSGNDLIFGASGANDLFGGAGDDLLVGGTNSDLLDGGLDADTMVGLAGDDTYIVDDLADVAVEAALGGTDTVATLMAALSIEAMANVENLSYLGLDADQFVGTGNSGNNNISGGDLADTLSGLAGNDTLEGGLDNDTLIGGLGNDLLEGGAGADSMTGGDGDDVYLVDDVGDVVNETGTTGTDRVESDVSFVLGAGVENLDLNSNAANGTGNDLANIINGNNEANQIFGGGGNDTLNGDDGADLVDGGAGNDTFNGAANDENDIYIGGAGNDTFNLNAAGGNDTLIYNGVFGDDVINNFDAIANGGQDLIDLSGFGVTATNFGARVFALASGGNTVITIRENGASSTIQGTITITGIAVNAIDANDFLLATVPTQAATITGTNGANALNGVGNTAELINALGGNDTVNANGGNDVVNGGEGADTLNGGDGNDTLSGGTGSDIGTMVDSFNAASYDNNNGTVNFAGNWTEGGGETTTSPTGGDIQITGGRLNFNQNVDGGETITRAVNLAGATAVSLSFNYEDDNLGNGQSVIIEAFNVVTNTWDTLTGGTLGSTTGNGTGTFNATLSANQIGAASAIRFRTTGDGDNWDTQPNNGDNFYVDNLTLAVTRPGQNAGVDTVDGGNGDDTIIWNANAVGNSTDGRDIVNGGTEGAAGDTFSIVGNASAETYNIYTAAAWIALGAGRTAAAGTEIVVTRRTDSTAPTNADIIAELTEIEEIRVNSVDPSGPTGSAGGDTFNIVGNFSGTSLRLNTITIEGDEGDNTVDISSLSSAHRIVFKSNGGHDTIIGTLRSQDVIELPEGANPDDYEVTENGNGTKTLASPIHSVTFTGEVPNFGGHPSNDEEDEDEDQDDHEQSCGSNNNDDEDENDDVGPPATQSGAPIVAEDGDQVLQGTAQGETILAFGSADKAVFAQGGDDVVRTGAGNDYVEGKEGADMVFAGAGNDIVLGGEGRDMLYGEAGDDRLFGDGGDDLIDAGAGNDAVYGGAGNDTFVASAGDGNDTYYGDDMAGGYGSDTLDMAAISANVTANLGANGGTGSASSSQSGNDVLRGVENIVTGSGDDRITAGSAANIMDAGGGSDTFVFLSASDANGDTILGFEPGDKIDLSAIDANAETGGKDAFTLTNGANFSGPAQLVISHETRADGDYTVVSGNVSGVDAAEFSISIKGTHDLKATDFVS